MNPTQLGRTYGRMAPLYDRLFRRFYRTMRRESLGGLELSPGDTAVLVGAGTGLDLELLPPVALALAVDVSRPMLRRLRPAPGVARVLADGARLPLRDATASAVVLHLVLSVAEEPRSLLAEAARVLQPGGRVAVLDHFAPNGPLSPWRRALARFPGLLGTHFDRRVEPMLAGLPFRIVVDRTLRKGVYRAFTLERLPDVSPSEHEPPKS